MEPERTPTPSRTRLRKFFGSDAGVVTGLTAMAFVVRLLAKPASLWEWDDFLFARSLYRYVLHEHSPHPPGFPVFVIMAKGINFFVGDVQQALLLVSLVFSTLLAPALFLFYREVFRDRTIALAGALICFCAPNILVQSGAGRSDGVALTITLITLTLAIKGMRSRGALVGAAALFGVGLGVRVTLLPSVAPTLTIALLAQLRQRAWKTAIVAVIVGAIGVLSWYVPLVRHTTWATYQAVMKLHSEYALTTDTIFAQKEPEDRIHRVQRFLIDVWGSLWIAKSMYGISALGLVMLISLRKWRPLGLLILAFVPYFCFVFIINTPLSAPLYSFPYIPFFTGLAGAGIVLSTRRIGSFVRVEVIRKLGFPLALGFAASMAVWTYPIVRMLHKEKSPPVRALEELQQRADPQHDVVWYEGLFGPQVRVLLTSVPTRLREEAAEAGGDLIPPPNSHTKIWGVTGERLPGVQDNSFSWSSNVGKERLRVLSLGRYFDVHVSDLTGARGPVYLGGWFPLEQYANESWRWMGRTGRVAVFNAATEMRFTLKGMLPGFRDPTKKPTVVIRLDGEEMDRFTSPTGVIDRSIVVKRDSSQLWSTLVIETDQVAQPLAEGASHDARELGLQCISLEWTPTPDSKPNPFNPEQLFTSGWYGIEGAPGLYWRWTDAEATLRLPAIDGNARLEITLEAINRPDGSRAPITLSVGGRNLETIDPPRGAFSKTYLIPGSVHHNRPTELHLSSLAIKPPSDPRPLSMCVYHIVWQSAP